jgi:hypothetical protein
MSHAYQSARMEREKMYQPIEKTYLTEEEYQAYIMLQTEHSYNTPEMNAVLKKIQGRDRRGIEAIRDKNVFHQLKDMRMSVKIPPRAPEERYPSASYVSSHPHIVEKSDTGKLYASDYFTHQGEMDMSFVPLQRRVDKTPLSPISGQGQAILGALRSQVGILAAQKDAFAMIDGYREGILRLSQDF